jgi:hypothetical protein
MKNLNICLLILVLLFVSSCENREPKPKTKYTVWVGSAAVAVGYHVNSYEIVDGMYVLIVCGKKTMIPEQNIFKIEEN